MATGAALLWLAAGSIRASAPDTPIDTQVLALGTVVRGGTLDGTVTLRNPRSEVLRIALARASRGITVEGLPMDVPPGGTAQVRLAVEAGDVNGLFQGRLVLAFNDPALRESTLTIAYRVADPIEIDPPRGFAVNVVRGQVREAAVEIVNNERAPLQLGAIEYPTDRFSARIDVVEPGRRYRLALMVPGGPESNTRADVISIQTSSRTMPLLKIPAKTTIRERVRVSPQSLDLGTIRLSDAAETFQAVRQSLVLTRTGTEDFLVQCSSNLPALDLQPRKAAGANRWHVAVALKPGLLHPGPMSGYVFVQTSDPDYPLISVPVAGNVIAR